MRVKLYKIIPALTLGIFLLTLNAQSVMAGLGDADVYVVFSGKDEKDKSAIESAFPGRLSVKFYNVDLLALADYSGKQKAVAKMDRAKLVLIIGDKAMELLEGSVFKSKLLVIGSARKSVQSDDQALHVLKKGADSAGIGGKAITATSAADLADIGESQIFIIDEAALDFYEAISQLTQTLSGS